MNATIGNGNTIDPDYSITTGNNSFTDTCPLMINYLNDLSAKGGILAATKNVSAGCYIGKPPTTSFGGINLGSSGASSPLPACRIYYSQIQVKPSKSPNIHRT